MKAIPVTPEELQRIYRETAAEVSPLLRPAPYSVRPIAVPTTTATTPAATLPAA